MRYFVKTVLPGRVRWEKTEGNSAYIVAGQVFRRVSPEIVEIFVARADNPADTFCDGNWEAEESREYRREEFAEIQARGGTGNGASVEGRVARRFPQDRKGCGERR